MSGRLVATLPYRVYKASGHRVDWNAVDRASGQYIYRMKAGNTVLTQRLMLIK